MNKQPVDYVNPNIGTIGHLLTATESIVALPHGMARAAPVTTPGITDKYLADRIYGFPAGCATIMPGIGFPDPDPRASSSGYDHDLETATPYWYSVLLEDLGVQTEFTVAQRAIYYRFVFPDGPEPYLIVRIPEQGRMLRIDADKFAVSASVDGVPHHLFFAFSEPVPECGVLTDDAFVFRFTGSEPATLEVKVGMSHIGLDQAYLNLERDIRERDFEGVKNAARSVWNEALSRIRMTGGTEEQRTVFYTALYRSLLHMVNIAENGKYFSGYDSRVHETDGIDFYTLDNLWDSYRCLHPLQLLLEPKRQLDMISSYIRMYEQSGWLPQFPGLAGDRPYMTGNHAAAMITDTYMKGYRDFDVAKAYEAMKKMAMEATMLPWTDNGPLTELDRVYLEHGYFPALAIGEKEWVPEVHGFERRQAVSLTLEHAYDDWCIGQMADALRRDNDYRYFMKRAGNYKNVFDERNGFMAPRTADGRWVEDFDPKLGGGQGGRDYFSECNSWIYTFHVQHDIPGLAALLGGTGKLAERLDALFTEQYGESKYGFLAQFPDATGLIGQYCQGNEPAFHIPYLYNYAGAPWKTQRKVREIMKLWFHDGPLGICGDEDSGAMSAWYVWSALGLYPVCPGKPVYDIGSPIFDEAVLALEDGTMFTIRAHDVSDKNKYIQSALLNGQPLDRPWIRHADIAVGGTLELWMGLRPNKNWGV